MSSMHFLKVVKTELKRVIYKGNKFICPFCNFKAKSLAPIGLVNDILTKFEIIGAGLRYAGCHICNSTDRERLIYIFLTKKLNIFQNKNLRILHVAPERKIKDILNAQHFAHYICGDKYAPGYVYDPDVINLDITRINFDDNFFDLIICNHVLEHVCDDGLAMREIGRVLKTDGLAILQVPISHKLEVTYEDININTPELKLIHFGQHDHLRIYGNDYIHKLRNNGLDVETINIFNDFSNAGLNPSEEIFLCRKKISI